MAKLHDEIARLATKYIHNWTHGKIGAFNFSGGWASEVVDGIVFTPSSSYMIEAKTSRADFLKDRKKNFRKFSDMGVGEFRFYACPPDLIKVEELPDKWGLLYVDLEKKEVKQIKTALSFERKIEREQRYLYYIATRLKSRKYLDNIL